ncbi:MAG: STT3 domain-containing protein, partial [Pseudomonadota bacterium]
MSVGLNREFEAQKKHFRLSPSDFRYAAFLLILAVGLYVRIDDFREWIAKPELSFFDGRPLPCETDSYYYLRLARDLYEGTYTQPDTLRHGIPSVSRPQPAPLLSILTASVSRLTGFGLDWVAAFLPAFLGLLLAFPLYGFGRHFCGTIAGLVSALMGLLSPFYVYRSDMGWFDTDCMNVTWSISIAFCFLKFGTCKKFFRYAWLAAGCAAGALFGWWWDQSPEAVFGITILPLTA